MQRGGVYTYRRVVVSALQPFFRCTEIWKSLGTDKRRACIAARRMAADFDRIAQLAKGGTLSTKDNKDVFRKLAQDYRREHDLDQWEVTDVDQRYIDDLVRRYAQERLDWLDTARARGYSSTDILFADPDKPYILPLVDPITRLDLSKGHFPERRGGAVSAEARDKLIDYYATILLKYQGQLALGIISPNLVEHANRVLDHYDDNRVTRYAAFVGEDDGTINPDPPPPLFRAFCLTLFKAEISCLKKESYQLSEAPTFPLQKIQAETEAPFTKPATTQPSLKLSKIIEKWLAWYKEQDSAKNSSLEEYQQAVELFREVIGDKPFATVTTEDVEDYLFLLKS
jgi:hypothetical protein